MCVWLCAHDTDVTYKHEINEIQVLKTCYFSSQSTYDVLLKNIYIYKPAPLLFYIIDRIFYWYVSARALSTQQWDRPRENPRWQEIPDQNKKLLFLILSVPNVQERIKTTRIAGFKSYLNTIRDTTLAPANHSKAPSLFWIQSWRHFFRKTTGPIANTCTVRAF